LVSVDARLFPICIARAKKKLFAAKDFLTPRNRYYPPKEKAIGDFLTPYLL
jgi:hypothetical protein